MDSFSRMDDPEIIRFPNDVALAEAAANDWLQSIPPTDGPPPNPWLVALSGGRIVRRFFEAAVKMCIVRRLSLDAVHFFWGDERCVPPDDPESNFGIARKDLLDPLKIPEAHVHRIRGEDTPESAARAAAAELQGLASASATGQPVLDLIFLGMGEDGHVASLFPGETEPVLTSPAVYRPVVASKPPPHRITLGYQVIAAARQVWVLASGAGKTEALRESLKRGGMTPLARVLSSRKKTRILTDIPA